MSRWILVAMGYEGSYRRRRGGRSPRPSAGGGRGIGGGRGRGSRSRGLWLQWDYGDGPVVAGPRAVLFCAWLAWSRFRVVVPLVDKTLASVVTGLDRALRLVGGVPSYALSEYVPGHIFVAQGRERAAIEVERVDVRLQKGSVGGTV
jgi:hypothetical protein